MHEEKIYIIESDFSYKGLRCVVIFTKMGHRCGYVGLKKSIWGYQLEEDQIEDSFQVHGGVTYSEEDQSYPVEDKSINHWIGFDCNHLGDERDVESLTRYFPNLNKHNLLNCSGYNAVKSKEYVESECKRLADQINKLIMDEELRMTPKLTNIEQNISYDWVNPEKNLIGAIKQIQDILNNALRRGKM